MYMRASVLAPLCYRLQGQKSTVWCSRSRDCSDGVDAQMKEPRPNGVAGDTPFLLPPFCFLGCFSRKHPGKGWFCLPWKASQMKNRMSRTHVDHEEGRGYFHGQTEIEPSLEISGIRLAFLIFIFHVEISHLVFLRDTVILLLVLLSWHKSKRTKSKEVTLKINGIYYMPNAFCMSVILILARAL